LREEWVNSKKLDVNEQGLLENPISYEELEKALKTCNFNSSTGWDGISNVLIKKFFIFIGKVLVLVAKNSFETGVLTTSFRLGQIKLIPKKGSPHKIEDWRPITLLCCGYKLISGVVAARLESTLDKIIGRAQKGFMGKKFMSTCTLNIMDRISGSWHYNEPLGVLCIDFIKAFDSVEHQFITNVLQFFNFGPIFIGMIRTLLSNRESVVIVGDGVTNSFKINRGTPQGDRISPYLFIIIIEILLIKLKRLEGRGVDSCNFIKNWAAGNDMQGEGNCEGFADDISVLFSMSADSVRLIKETLAQFALCSGLSINIKKTQLMVCGTENFATGTKVHDIEVVDRVKILGLTIDRKLENLDVNWEEKVAKMERLSNFWQLQKLKISGRVLVAKTFLLSQVVFLLETLPLKFDIGERINKIMAYFVKGTDRVIAKNRWFLDRELGGYGLVDIHSLNTCVKANWINRWVINFENMDIIGKRGLMNFEKPVDQWGVDVSIEHSDRFKYNIMCEWRNFKHQFYMVRGNISEACLFENDGILVGKKNLGVTIFGLMRYNSLTNVKKMLPVKTFCENGMVKTKTEVERVLGMNINLAEYFRLRNTVGEISRIYGYIGHEGKCLDTFVRGRKRRGGELRKSVSNKYSAIYFRNDPRMVPSAQTLWGVALNNVDRSLIEANFGLWGLSNLGADFRMFIFNFLQGRLYLNNTLARIDNSPATCTFCEIKGRRELEERGIAVGMPEYGYYLNLLPVESVDHFFWSCETSNDIIQKCYRWVRGFDWYNGNERIEKNTFLIGIESWYKKLVTTDLIWKHYLRFFLYICRARKKIPYFPSLKFELESLFKNPGMYQWLRQMVQLNNIY